MKSLIDRAAERRAAMKKETEAEHAVWESRLKLASHLQMNIMGYLEKLQPGLMSVPSVDRHDAKVAIVSSNHTLTITAVSEDHYQTQYSSVPAPPSDRTAEQMLDDVLDFIAEISRGG